MSQVKEELPIGNLPPQGFMIASNGDKISIMSGRVLQPMTKDQALNLASWLVVLADPSRERFDKFFDAVCNT